MCGWRLISRYRLIDIIPICDHWLKHHQGWTDVLPDLEKTTSQRLEHSHYVGVDLVDFVHVEPAECHDQLLTVCVVMDSCERRAALSVPCAKWTLHCLTQP